MSLTAEQREILLNGPTSPGGHKRAVLKAFDGPCRLITAWRKHRAELWRPARLAGGLMGIGSLSAG